MEWGERGEGVHVGKKNTAAASLFCHCSYFMLAFSQMATLNITSKIHYWGSYQKFEQVIFGQLKNMASLCFSSYFYKQQKQKNVVYVISRGIKGKFWHSPKTAGNCLRILILNYRFQKQVILIIVARHFPSCCATVFECHWGDTTEECK